ncbi:MAG TPA: TSUP family transporter, partial [Thiobacillus sp.]|nr:TSUP family transporter [Thiobacillus sp.]
TNPPYQPHWIGSLPVVPAGSLGFVYLPALFGIVLGSVLTAPLGARTAHRLPVKPLKRVFALLLMVLALRMAWTF